MRVSHTNCTLYRTQQTSRKTDIRQVNSVVLLKIEHKLSPILITGKTAGLELNLEVRIFQQIELGMKKKLLDLEKTCLKDRKPDLTIEEN